MNFEPGYFEDEIRDGFYIPGMVKRSWAASLRVLEVIDKIAKKHNLTWFADFGTLIGAVRHEGLIPWDDDIDICMSREDYEKFKIYAEKELPKGYEYLCFDNEPEYENFILRITNNHSINMTNDYLMDNYGFPYTAGIDIFALDYIYADEEKEKERREIASKIWQLAENLKSGELSIPRPVLSKQIEDLCGYKMNPSLSDLPAINRILEKIFSQCSKDQASAVALMPRYIKNLKRAFPLDYFSSAIEIPFENTTIKVPTQYDDILYRVYDKWEEGKRYGGAHNYPFFAEQESIALQGGMKIPYKYNFLLPGPEENERRKEHEERSDNGLAIIHTLVKVMPVIMSSIASGNLQTAAELLENSQQLSIQLGNNLEKTYADPTSTVSLLEQYCELIFNLYNMLASGQVVDLALTKTSFEDLLEEIEVSYKALNKEPGDVLFVLARANEWPFVEKLYRQYEADEAYNVYVMAVPFAYRDNCGAALELQCQAESFPKDINLISYDSYPFATKHAAKIFITNPFDEYKSGMTLHGFFYASNLRHICNELIYVQAFELNGVSDDKSRVNARTYVLTPGVSLADKILLPNQEMKELYSSILSEECKISSEKWQEKIEVLSLATRENAERKRDILFYVSISDILKGEEKAISWINEAIEIFESNCKQNRVYWYIDPTTMKTLHEANEKLASDVEGLIARFADNKNFEILVDKNRREAVLDRIGGFYGSGGYLLNQCVIRKIPVMLRNRSIRL